ncbi:hypothetical protein [Kitasatospora purpeofusca]|uniref:hypothetical protein n=1 Tax=Kitasatospora purpeofusca TaxID=67352 RepID=UPI0035E3B2B6
MGKASRRRREDRPKPARAVSKLYSDLPSPVIEACEDVLRAYTTGSTPTAAPATLRCWQAEVYAEEAALEALDLLTARRGSSSDLLFTDLYNMPAFEPFTPAMPSLLRFLRARRANLNPTLRLAADTPGLALTLLLLAGHALVQAADTVPGDPQAQVLLAECLARLAAAPLGERVLPGDLAFALTEEERRSVEDAVYARDEHRRFLTEAVPLRRSVAAAPGRAPLLVLDLSARDDVEDLMRVMQTDNPADGADTVTRWRALAGLIRLEVTWLEPVYTELAVVLQSDQHRELLAAVAADGRIALTGTDPADSLDTEFSITQVATDGLSLAHVMAAAATSFRP